MTSGPQNLYDLASALRDSIVAEFAADGVDLPTRRELTAYQAVAECDKLSVSWSRMYVGQAAAAETPAPVTRAITRAVILEVFLFRCVWTPNGEGIDLTEGPSVEELDDDARVIMTDAYTLHRGISRARLAGTFEGFCTSMSLGPAEPIVPDGGISGTHMAITVELS